MVDGQSVLVYKVSSRHARLHSEFLSQQKKSYGLNYTLLGCTEKTTQRYLRSQDLRSAHCGWAPEPA